MPANPIPSWHDTRLGHSILTLGQPAAEGPLYLLECKQGTNTTIPFFMSLVCRGLCLNPGPPEPGADTLPVAY